MVEPECHNALRSIAVVGNNAVAWTSAAILAQSLNRHGVVVTLVAGEQTDAQPLVEVSQPALPRLIELWQLSERELLSACSGLFSLGIKYRTPDQDGFFLPFGTHGMAPSPASFEQTFFKLCPKGQRRQFNHYFLSTQAALRGRFDFPVDDPRSVKSTLRYGLHLDLARFIQYLESKAGTLGFNVVRAEVTEVTPSAGGERIEALDLSNGQRLEADFYMDCSGERGQLIDEGLGVGYQSWSHWLPWDSQLSCFAARRSDARPYSEISLNADGWEKTVGLQTGRVHQYFYREASGFDPEAYCRKVGADPVSTRPLRPGRRDQFWTGNCLALGDAAGSATPVVLSELHWATKSLLLWLELYPHRDNQEALQREYNRRCGEILDGFRDFHVAHTLAGAGPDALTQGPESLAWKLSLFTVQGRLWLNDEEPVPQETWVALLLGLGIEPDRYDVVLDGVDEAVLRTTHEKIYRKLAQESERMPSLEEVVARYCPAPKQ